MMYVLADTLPVSSYALYTGRVVSFPFIFFLSDGGGSLPERRWLGKESDNGAPHVVSSKKHPLFRNAGIRKKGSFKISSFLRKIC